VLRDAGPKGLGVFVTRRFLKGEPVLQFDGPRLTAETIQDFTHTLQIEERVFLGASGGIDDFVNHSCDPNTGLACRDDRWELIALTVLLPGDEVTFDYSTCMAFEPALDTCLCGAASCRGRIDRFADLGRATRARYLALGVVPQFLTPPARAKR